MLYNHENNQLFHSFYIFSKSSLSEWHSHIRELFWGKVIFFPNLYIVESVFLQLFFFFGCGASHMACGVFRSNPFPLPREWGVFTSSGVGPLPWTTREVICCSQMWMPTWLLSCHILFSPKLCSYQFILRRVLQSVMFFLWIRGQQTFSGKTQIENILGFAGNTVSCN